MTRWYNPAKMHPLRKQILHSLIINPSLPYSKLKPKEVEGNLFMYHIKQLITEGLVGKRPDGRYELSSQGKIFADQLSLKNFKPRVQPKIVTLIVCRNNRGEFLLYKRKRQPFLGQTGFPYGKIHLGETIAEAASRELKEKTGLSAEIKYRGEVYLMAYEGVEILSQMLCHIFEGKNPKGELMENSEIGECFWEEVKDPEEARFMAGFADVYKLISRPLANLFFEEFTYSFKRKTTDVNP